MLLFYQIILSLCVIHSTANKPCISVYYENRDVPMAHRMNCKCNATYCDTIKEMPLLDCGEYVQYTSNIDGLRFQQIKGIFQEKSPTHDLEMRIDITKKFQPILGFGTTFTDAAGININSLSPGARTNLLRAYFAPEGIELTMARVPIAGTDLSSRPYTLDDVDNDKELMHYNLTWEDFQLKIPQIQESLRVSDRKINLMAAAWTAPPWMKTVHGIYGGFLYKEFYSTWAEYHLKFLDAYHSEGIDFWSISTGNEPLNGLYPALSFNAMGWLPHTQFKWVRENLGPAVRNSKHNNTKILTSDDQRFMVQIWAFALTFDKLAASFIDGFGVHWYTDIMSGSEKSLDVVHELFPDKFIIANEASFGAMPWEDQVIEGSWERAVIYVKDIIENMEHWAGGWLDFSMALAPDGGPSWTGNTLDAPIIVNTDEDSFYKQPMFYALGHFSKFVTEGSIRVEISQHPKSKVQSVAFQTADHKLVVVILNENDKNIPVVLTDPNLGQIRLELTSNSFQTIVYPTKKIKVT